MARRKSRAVRGPYLHHVELLADRIPADRFPFNLPAIRSLKRLEFHPGVTFFVGENGSGKSTLLEALAVGSDLNAEGGSIHFRFATRASHSDLDRALRLAKSIFSPPDSYFLRSESFYNVATEIENLDRTGTGPRIIDSYGGVSLHDRSHGEAFLAYFQHRFGSNGLYFFDEPEAALSPRRLTQVLRVIHDAVERGGQFVIATHSPILLCYPHCRIYEFTPTGIHPRTLRELAHFQITQQWMLSPEDAFRELLSAPPSTLLSDSPAEIDEVSPNRADSDSDS
ncbi:atpase aaa : Uncharacterized protein OS=Cupriavidus sp. HMR-1 GN=D769_13266 PE=4 SV=1: AAA_21 [Tuwongella immobilis]|uniref:AAA+ ATPase domain-containing protein n=2 Tax=Tuwongella immobilis TaxID=692036 RepID=A0A6C2YR46_9BACT|nr:atpase aaa : Uncharacterized protein OS=Cupriavidus sp. HMR-1 GN=D769_13266 PE=4 SV=1: AAA_21 [Tuwongella immobilis]VTS04626.1 atpase aaa : Uncharacterized protein OS=Cupriavidus sp. HMR-1 GN=D769_13266 PE=4 SV=1: AAA_21 [Tuwongella immobilis]